MARRQPPTKGIPAAAWFYGQSFHQSAADLPRRAPVPEPVLTHPAFTEDEYDFLESALRCAAEQYVQDAKTCEKVDQPRLVEQFTRQAEQARDLANRIALR